MAVDNFIPQIWAAAILSEFRQAAVAAALTTREYEGLARVGNTVKVTTGVPVEVKDYKAGMVSDGATGTIPRTTVPDKVTTTQIDLLIDQEKSFDFLVDDIDKRQAAGSLDTFAKSAAEGLAEDADKWILAQIAAQAAAANKLAAAAVTTGNGAWDKVRDLRKALNKAKAPQAGRVLLVNAEYQGLLEGADSKFTDANVSGSPAGLRDATIGRMLGMDVIATENLPNVAKPMAIALVRSSFAFVSQVDETEGMRANDTFADRLRGLHVYGGKMIRPTAVATFTAS